MALTYPPFNSTNFPTASDHKVRDVSTSIDWLGPRFAQLMLLSLQPSAPSWMSGAYGNQEPGARRFSLRSRTVTNWKYEWIEDTNKSSSTQVNNGGGYNNSATDIIVDDSTIFQINDIIDVISTGEILMVTANNTGTNTITVTRSWGATAAASIADNAVLLRIGNAFSEAGALQVQPQSGATFKYNYIQDTRTAFAVTHALNTYELYGISDYKSYQRMKHLRDHYENLERTLLFGERNAGTSALSDGSPQYSTGGLLEFMTSNVLAVGGALTKTTFHNWLRDLFTYGGPEKVILCSPTVAAAISNFATDDSAAPKSTMWIMNKATEYGLNIMTYMTKFGTVHLVIHGQLTGSVYGGYAIALEPDQLGMARVRGGYYLSLREDVIKDGRHVEYDEYVTYFGLEVKNPAKGGVLTGVTA